MGVNSNQYLQGINQTTGTGAPVHSAVAGDRYTDTATGITYQYTTSWQTVSYSAGGLTYFTEAQNTTAPNATVPVDSLTAVTGTTNGDFAILPKGTGAFIVGHIPDGTPTNGGKRGTYAVDIQPANMSYASGATGSNSVAIGTGCSATASNAIAIGSTFANAANAISIVSLPNNGAQGVGSILLGSDGNGNCTSSGSYAISIQGGSATGTNSFAHGASTSSGNNSVALGGRLYAGNVASGNSSFAVNANTFADALGSSTFGAYSKSKGVPSRLSIGSFQDVGPYLAGSSQLSLQSVMQQSTTATAVEMTTYGGTAIAIIMQDNESIRIRGSILGRQTTSLNTCSYDFDCLIVRGVGVATTVMRVNNMNLVYDDISVTTLPTLSANTSLGGLSIKSGGKATTTIRWSARIDSVESILA